MFTQRLQALISILCLCGCTSHSPTTNPRYEAELEQWIGREADKLVQQWGVPSSHWKQGDGTSLLVYRRGSATVVGSGPGPLQLDPVLVQRDCVTTFTADRRGRLVSWEYEGNAC